MQIYTLQVYTDLATNLAPNSSKIVTITHLVRVGRCKIATNLGKIYITTSIILYILLFLKD